MIRIYYRVSTDKQDFNMQDTAIKNMLKSKCIDYNLCEIYKDFGISGTTTERPDYQRLLLEIEPKDTIVVYELSRLWRDMADQTAAVKQLLKKDISFLAVADGELTNTNGNKLIANIKGSINEFEAERLKIRINAGLKAKKEKVEAKHGEIVILL